MPPPEPMYAKPEDTDATLEALLTKLERTKRAREQAHYARLKGAGWAP